MQWHMPLILALERQKQVGLLSMRSACTTEQIPEQPHRNPVSDQWWFRLQGSFLKRKVLEHEQTVAAILSWKWPAHTLNKFHVSPAIITWRHFLCTGMSHGLRQGAALILHRLCSKPKDFFNQESVLEMTGMNTRQTCNFLCYKVLILTIRAHFSF